MVAVDQRQCGLASSVLAAVSEDPLCRDVWSLALPFPRHFRYAGGRRGQVGGGLRHADAA